MHSKVPSEFCDFVFRCIRCICHLRLWLFRRFFSAQMRPSRRTLWPREAELFMLNKSCRASLRSISENGMSNVKTFSQSGAELVNVARVREVWVPLLELLPIRPPDKRFKDEEGLSYRWYQSGIKSSPYKNDMQR